MNRTIRSSLAHVSLAVALAACGSGSAPEAAPLVAVDTPSIEFTADEAGSAPAVRKITVTNAGGGTLDAPTVEVSYTEGAEGWLSATVAGFEVTVAAATGSLSRGHYAGVVTISSTGSSNGSVTIPVALDLFQPALALSATSLTLSATTGSIPAPVTFTVANAGDGALATPTVTSGMGIPLTATVTGTSAPFTVAVTLETPIVLQGVWTGSLTVSASNATNGSLTIPVSIVVRLPPPPPDAVTVVCNRPADYLCVELTSTSEPERTDFQQSCLAGSGALVAACPEENKYAGCADIGREESRATYWYYSPGFCPLNMTMCSYGIWTEP